MLAIILGVAVNSFWMPWQYSCKCPDDKVPRHQSRFMRSEKIGPACFSGGATGCLLTSCLADFAYLGSFSNPPPSNLRLMACTQVLNQQITEKNWKELQKKLTTAAGFLLQIASPVPKTGYFSIAFLALAFTLFTSQTSIFRSRVRVQLRFSNKCQVQFLNFSLSGAHLTSKFTNQVHDPIAHPANHPPHGKPSTNYHHERRPDFV